MSEAVDSDKPAVVFEFTGEHSRDRRVRFVREQPGGWTYVEEQQDGDDWRPLGAETVADLDVAVDPGALDAISLSTSDEAAIETVTGPEVATR